MIVFLGGKNKQGIIWLRCSANWIWKIKFEFFLIYFSFPAAVNKGRKAKWAKVLQQAQGNKN